MNYPRLIITNILNATKEVALKDLTTSSEVEIKYAIGNALYKYYKNQIPFNIDYGFYSSSPEDK